MTTTLRGVCGKVERTVTLQSKWIQGIKKYSLPAGFSGLATAKSHLCFERKPVTGRSMIIKLKVPETEDVAVTLLAIGEKPKASRVPVSGTLTDPLKNNFFRGISILIQTRFCIKIIKPNAPNMKPQYWSLIQNKL